MGKSIKVVEAPASTIPSLPPRLAALAGALGTIQHPGQPARHHFQTGWQMSALERAEAASLLSTLTSSLDATASFDGKPGQMAKGTLLAKMIRGLAGPAETSEVAAAAKVEMYADAIDDLPAWAIDLAIKRWARGTCPETIEEKPRYAFPPAPATLRALALLAIEAPKRDARMLTNLLAAMPLEAALDPDHREVEAASAPALRRM